MPNYYEEISVIELQNRLQKGMPVTGNVAFNNGNKAALQIEPLMTTEIERYRTGSYALVSFSHIIPEWATNPLVIDQQPAQIQEGNSIDIFSNLNATVGVSADIADKLGYKHTMRFFARIILYSHPKYTLQDGKAEANLTLKHIKSPVL